MTQKRRLSHTETESTVKKHTADDRNASSGAYGAVSAVSQPIRNSPASSQQISSNNSSQNLQNSTNPVSIANSSSSSVSSPPGSSNGQVSIPRTISACQRCRLKKVKCDQRFPKCTKCERNGAPCIGLDPVTGREVPRSYIVHLETRIKMLEEKLRENGLDAENSTKLKHENSELTSENPISSLASPLSEMPPKPPLQTGGTPSIAFSRLMTTAVRVNRKSIPTSVESFEKSITASGVEILPAILPPKITALQFIQIFFAQSNSQVPVLHREEFIKSHFIPIYGPFDYNDVSIASDFSSVNTEMLGTPPAEDPWFIQYINQFQAILGHKTVNGTNEEIKRISNSIIPPRKYHKSLYFLNIIFAIASSVHHLQYPSTISESFRLAASRYFSDVKYSSDQLESLQAVLLQSVYATMRPTNPAVWYVIGTALRMCVDMDLHNENNTTTASNMDAFQKDKRRRLFWCTYSIDRQICFYLDRPIGIPDESIHTPFPSGLDDSYIKPNETEIADYTIYYDNNPIQPSYKSIALSMFKIRQIQSEVQRVLYTNAEIPRNFKTLADWKTMILRKLSSWNAKTPKTPQEMNCNFNLAFFTLNYNHTLLMLHNLSPKNYKLSTNDIIQVSESSKELINCYAQLFSTKSINYTWAAVHNLFMAGTSFLYTVYNSEEVRNQNSLQSIKKITSDCLNVLTSLIDRCEAAISCCEVFQSLTMAIIKLKYNEVVQGFSNLKVTKDNLNQVNNNNVKSNLSKFVENLNNDSAAHETLNPFSDANSGLVLKSETPGNNDVESKAPIVFEWLSETNREIGEKFQLPISNETFDLDTFFKELETLSPVSLHSRRNSGVHHLNPQAGSPHKSDVYSNGSSPNVFHGSKEGKRTFELLHQTPNEIIQDQFFTGTNLPFSLNSDLIIKSEDLGEGIV